MFFLIFLSEASAGSFERRVGMKDCQIKICLKLSPVAARLRLSSKRVFLTRVLYFGFRRNSFRLFALHVVTFSWDPFEKILVLYIGSALRSGSHCSLHYLSTTSSKARPGRTRWTRGPWQTDSNGSKTWNRRVRDRKWCRFQPFSPASEDDQPSKPPAGLVWKQSDCCNQIWSLDTRFWKKWLT